jgi:transaldolase/glucose-6-phosphate isomerase
MRAEGIVSPGERCIALTDEGSYLTALAREYKFRDILFDPPGILSRFCGLLHFGLLLIAAGVTEKAGLLESVLEMKEWCGPSMAISENPAAQLGAFLAAGAEQGYSRLVLLSDTELNYFAYRITQLVGLSVNAQGQGLQPFFGQNVEPPRLLREKCLVVVLRLKEGGSGLIGRAAELRNAGVPVVEMELDGAAGLAAEILRWEIATVLACVALGVNCFQSEDGHGNLAPMWEELQRVVSKDPSASTGERLREEGIALYAKGRTRRLISNLSLRDALKSFLEQHDAGGYVAICPFFQLSAENLKVMRLLRDCMTEALIVPVQISTGPRYLYALGKSYKRSPAKGIFIILTAEPDGDIAIPGAPYTFGELQLAFALAEWDALESAQKPVIRAHLFDGREKGVRHFADVAIQALAQIRSVSHD